MADIPPPIKTKELHICYQPISKLYNDDCGHFPIRSRSGNDYIIIAYHCDLNTILQAPFSNRENKHRIRSYNSIMKRLDDQWHQVGVQILDNKVSAEFKQSIVDYWGATYQLVPPNVHRINIAERSICNFKANFLSVIAVVDPEFYKFMWDNLFFQTDLTLNLICQATLNPCILAWEYLNSAFDYVATPLGPIRCRLVIHITSKNRKSCD